LFPDSLASCPAGDSIVFTHSALHPHPARLRIVVGYFDADCDPRVDVPPESIWVTFTGFTGTLEANDLAAKTYADDSTDAGGAARITVPSFSGSGNATVKLFVSGVSQGTKTVRVRTVDTNADGRFDEDDVSGLADINYDGAQNARDLSAAFAHNEHWHRNALHGTLVRRTNFCEGCGQGDANTRGLSLLHWSPSQRFISYTAFVGSPPKCNVFAVPSDPTAGNVPTQISSPPLYFHDYDPSWSPLNTEIVFDRGDSVIIKKPVPWLSGGETALTASSNCGEIHGDNIPVISPDGQWVAFSRCNGAPTGGWSLWKIPATGGTAVQLTPTDTTTDFYASWSPDGSAIYFQRSDPRIGLQWMLYKVPAAGGTAEAVFTPQSTPETFDAVQPAATPDGQILVVGYGRRDNVVRNVVTHTLDPALVAPSERRLVPNYSDPEFGELGQFPILTPRLSHDGTRLALGSKQIWAARRNMNLPPAFSSVTSTEEGTRSIPDTAATMSFTFDAAIVNSITVTATDPEGDALTYQASFVPAWMSWSPTTATLSGDPPPTTLGKTFYVKLWATTPSGGTDSFIAVITVANTLGPSAARRATDDGAAVLGPNPTSASFRIASPFAPGAVARLRVYDLAGRRVADVRGRAGDPLVWDGKDRSNALVPSGVYLWRMDAAGQVREGKVVVAR
jgi:hypothetical protein